MWMTNPRMKATLKLNQEAAAMATTTASLSKKLKNSLLQSDRQ
jgi:hypothetical protein